VILVQNLPSSQLEQFPTLTWSLQEFQVELQQMEKLDAEKSRQMVTMND
jgi:hypothetical protein